MELWADSCTHPDDTDAWRSGGLGSRSHLFYEPEDDEDVEPTRLRVTSQESDDLQRVFEKLASEWRRDTEHLSLVARKTAHPNYLEIIKLGTTSPVRIVSLILKELRKRPAFWFAALETITG